MKPTRAQMQRWFNEFNKSVFEGKLPIVPITFNNTRRQLGQFYWRDGGSTYGIKISLFWDRNEEQYRNCLLHEMCHLYCFKQGWKKEGHGPRWKAIANKAYRITGLYIQRCENTTGWEASTGNESRLKAARDKRNAPAILVDLDYGTYHFIVKTTKRVLWDASDGNKIKGSYEHRVKGIYICDHPRVVGWQNSRSLHRGYKFSNYDYEKTIKPILEKGMKVDNLRALCHWGEYDCLGVR